MARTLLLSLIFIIFSILPHHYIYSYCVRNNMQDGTEINVYQEDGQGSWHKSERTRFHVEHMIHYHRECCSENSFRCNKERKNRDHLLTLVLSYSSDGFQTTGGTYKVILPAAGYLEVQGTYNAFTYEVLDSQLKPFPQPTWANPNMS